MTNKRNIFLVSPEFPPFVSGVGDHTAYLAAEIERGGLWDVRVLTSVEPTTKAIRYTVERAFDVSFPSSIASIVDCVARDKPDWVIVQYNPFSYGGRYGFNPSLVNAVRRIKQHHKQTKVGLILHESFVTMQDWRSTALSVMLNCQLWLMCQSCDVVFPVIESWTQKLRSWFPKKRIEHLPVGSNLPLSTASRAEMRRQLDIGDGTVVLGYFGRVRGSRSVQSRNLEHLTATVKQTQAAGINVIILYLGLEPDAAKETLGHLPLIALGPLAAEKIASFLLAMDVYLLPFTQGVSTRRTSLMCALQHQLPIVATSGADTDLILQQQNQHSLLLVPEEDVRGFAMAALRVIRDPDLQKALSMRAYALFLQNFTWDKIGAKFLDTMVSFTTHAR